MSESERTGGCACGRVTFLTRGEPIRVGLCHCLTCRKISGSVFNAFAIFPADRVTVSGELSSFDMSGETVRHFCPACGSQVLGRWGDEVEVRLGAFDAPNVFRPTYEAWVGRREAWLHVPGLKAFERNRDDP